MQNKQTVLILIFSIFISNLFSQEAGITNPAENLIIHRYNFDTNITGTRTCAFDGWANAGNIGIKLYVNGSYKSLDCNNCGTWETTKDISAGTNDIYIESRKDNNTWVASLHRSITFMKPLNDDDFYLSTYPNDGYIKITWLKHTSNGTSNFHYRVYRNTINEVNSGSDWLILGDWTQGNTYSDYPPETGVTYYYWVVCASNNSGLHPSAFGTSRNTILNAPAPNTPANFTATAISNSEIQLNWNASENATGYQIFTCDGSSIATEPTTSYTVSDLSADTYYNYKIRATNMSGASDYTSCEGATTSSVNITDIENNFIKIYPNPTNGIINLKINKQLKNAFVEITDINGKIIFSKTIS